MENKLLAALASTIVAGICSVSASASSYIVDEIVDLSLTTDRGDFIRARANSDGSALDEVCIQIGRRSARIPATSFDGLRYPKLAGLRIYMGGRVEGHQYRKLIIPFREYRDEQDVSAVYSIKGFEIVSVELIRGYDLDQPMETRQMNVSMTNRTCRSP
ncbi:hypothetical protein [Arenimonas sp. MALMAid1274]|uniref:hypothetical protein n=1 Tax=Arenimonas sp. MALMAid1274 TaxID=3411630 RepID=UPI003BA2CAE3